MKIKCKRGSVSLTVGKMYTITKIEHHSFGWHIITDFKDFDFNTASYIIEVIDDDGDKKLHLNSNFDTMEYSRGITIDKILS